MDASTDPFEPAEPVDLFEPAAREGAAERPGPPEPVDLFEPIEPIEPIEPAGTVAALEPGEPAEPTGTAEPVDLAGTTGPVDAVGTTGPVDAVGAVGPGPFLDAPRFVDRCVDASPPTSPAVRRSPQRTATARLLLVAVLAAVALVVAGPRDADRRFVDAARAQGHQVQPGDQQALLVSGARKLCKRVQSRGTAAQRRATALSAAEVGAVTATFPDDTRGFTTLALDTYCSL